MQPSARLFLNMTGDKSFFLWNGTETYYRQLRSAYVDIVNDVKSDYLYFSFFTLCASTLEYSLNYVLANYCLDKFGPLDYKSYYEEYLSLRFRNKLLLTPHIVSDGKFRLIEDCPSFKHLEEMIILRNRILHNKESLKEIDIPIDGWLEGDKLFVPTDKVSVEFKMQIATNHIDTLTKEKCIMYGNALGDFKQYIMTPALTTSFIENQMISRH